MQFRREVLELKKRSISGRYYPAVISGFLLFLMVIGYACNPQAQPVEEHPAYFDSVMAATDSVGHISEEAALVYLEQAYASAPATGKLDLVRKHSRLSIYWTEAQHNYRKGMTYIDSALQLFDEPLQQRYPGAYAQALFFKGSILRELKLYDEVYIYLYRARGLLSRINDSCIVNEYMSSMALTYYRQKKYSEAAPYFLKSFQVLGGCDPSSYSTYYHRAGALDNAALSYDHAGDNARALYFYDSTLRFMETEGAKFRSGNQPAEVAIGKAIIYGNKGGVLLRMGDTLQAEIMLRRSIDTNLELKGGDIRDALFTLNKLIGLYLSAGRLEEARAQLEVMGSRLPQVPDPVHRKNWLSLQGQYFEQSGLRKQAFRMLKASTELGDSMAAVAAKPSIVDVNKALERIDKERHLVLLQKDHKLHQVYLVLLVAACLVVIVVAITIWMNWHRSRRHAVALRALNDEISGQKENIRRNLVALEQSQQDQYHLMKIVAHDLRNPVGAIQTLSEMLPSSDPVDQDLVALIQTSAVQAMNLISELMVLDPALINLHKERIDLTAELKYCVDLSQLKAREKHQRILFDVVPVTVMASREKLWRVFSNLITNAIKFSPDGADIAVKLQRKNGKALITVSDQGIGIPAMLQDKIFSLSTEVKRPGTRGESSFGLGLSISRQIVEAHGGSIWFETEEGKGTTFYIEIDTCN